LLLGSEPGLATIGGAISCDANGPARVRCGAVRDHLLGFRGVNGLGEAFKAGGKVVKNVTGFDLPKLVCGAFGTLCVLTEVTLRVFPKPPLAATLAVRGLSPEEGFALLRKVWSSPLDATGLAFSHGRALIRVEGEKEPLAEKCAALRTLIGAREVEEIAEGEIAFRAIGSGEVFADMPYDVWRAFVPPASAAAVAAEIDAPLWLGDWAGGLLWLGTAPGSDTVREVVTRHGGHCVLLRAEEETRERVDVFDPEAPARAALTRSVKAAFDPLGLFNPGRMWPQHVEAV
jgi:glycolate oxidase FAD binding subunit